MILVFGGQGQVGQELVEQARIAGVPLSAVGRGEADIAERSSVMAAIDRYRPAIIVNAAAYNQVDKAESEVHAAERANVEGPGVLAACAAAAGLPLIHISTDYVFDGTKGSPYDEDDAVNPLSVYGRTKEQGEERVRAALAEHLVLRTAWVYGLYANNVMKTILKLAAEKDELSFASDQVGSPTASADLALAILTAARVIGAGEQKWGTYHVAGEGSASRFDLAAAVVCAQVKFTGRSPSVVPTAASAFRSAARRPSLSALDSSRFAAAFGYRPRFWKDAVEQTVGAYFSDGMRA